MKTWNDYKEHIYKVGEQYPHAGYEVSDKRLKELLSSANRLGTPLIKEVVAVDKTLESLNPAIPAQSETIEQDTPFKEEIVAEAIIPEKPKKGRRRNKEIE